MSYQRSFRLDDAQGKSLEEIAKANDVDVSQLMRWAAGALIRHVEKHDGRLLLPLDFTETYEVIRRERSEDILKAAEEPVDYRTKRTAS